MEPALGQTVTILDAQDHRNLMSSIMRQLIRIKSKFWEIIQTDRLSNKLRAERRVVEKSHTAGSWPDIYAPLRGIGQKVADWFAPRSEASAMEDCYEIKVELPGVKADEVDVSIHDNSLTVRGEKKFEREEKGRDFFFSEREYGTFQRTFRLPPDASSDNIDASFNDGVLSLKIAKQAPSEPAARKINIRRS